jgi:hypothetical protein
MNLSLNLNSMLVKIKLTHNNIGAEGAKSVAEALKVNSTLLEIVIGRNLIGAE